MDPYTYPGTNVPKNRRDIRDLELLSRFEMDMTTRRAVELAHNFKPGKFDIAHIKSIHRYIFQDVYDWAGELRTVDISRPGQYLFARVPLIIFSLETAFTALSKEHLLKGLDVKQFSLRGAYYMGEINAIHPFRDGNGRTQREFIRQLALHNGYSIHWSCTTRGQMGDASKLSFQTADNSGLASVILKTIEQQ